MDPYDWSRDGRWLALSEPQGSGISAAPATPDGKPFVYLDTPANEDGPRFSPDGKWLAYVSNESGRYEVYASPFSGAPAAPESKVQISNGGGDFPVWRPEGGELYYLGADSILYAVATAEFGKSAQAPNPVPLFHACPGRRTQNTPATNQTYGYPYDTHDGKRFLFNCTVAPDGQFTVLLNWPFRVK
jgi:Tol biopolymer transport system component